ncbi:hypothetical protein PoB_004608500 [Plakobranchus ocellatus]|uniref:THAP-type domain-containing protein n=1 Tax=Plakobranchus ocellatus TaxID=259542 RepID=A0AAV4BJA4_9GAST|nr:hypothetical protein PoB_004608500 [Plakobranchus ocellatus]
MRKKRCAGEHATVTAVTVAKTTCMAYHFDDFQSRKHNLKNIRGWIMLCNPPHTDLSVDKIGSDHYVCSKGFMVFVISKMDVMPELSASHMEDDKSEERTIPLTKKKCS